ncbi:MAG: Holliday junction branch migration protein RuvA [Acidobacteria bacterium]|nr:Holliday junction branch migration protein RuvA [Acidobacteriota bacterium]
MIGRLTGTLIHKSPTSLLLDVGGVGYEVTVPLSTYYQLPETGLGCALLIHTHVREDALQLFGFQTSRERQLFLKLISVSGIGPRLAITILSGLSPEEIILSIRGSDFTRLTAVPGIGRKTAERLVVELRDRVEELAAAGAGRSSSLAGSAGESDSQVADDVVSALVNLGYPRPMAERTVASVICSQSDHSTAALLKASLKLLLR